MVGGVSVFDIVSSYGTPVFVYDGNVLDRKWDVLRKTFPPKFSICYSVKANPNPEIMKQFLSKGAGLEIASGGELHLALRAGCPPEKILFAGPGKTEGELELALGHRIGEVHVESLLEIDRVARIAEWFGVRARVAVRVNPSEEAQGGAMRMGGKSAPFGIDEEQLDRALDRLLAERFIDFQGIHLFTGTQILDHAVLVRQYRKGLEVARRVAERTRRGINTVDFGGGLGIPYFSHEHELDMETLGKELDVLMNEVKSEELFAQTRFVIEPGRYLVGEAGIYVARISDIKVSRGSKFVILDGGMNHHLAASGNLGQVIKRNFPLVLLGKMDDDANETVDVVGPLCTPLDALGRGVQIPSADVGELVGILQSGAYARTSSPLGFLSHPTPPEVLAKDGRVRLIRRRGGYEGLFADSP
jgi:diaminopimelate decarboxylase